MIRAKHKAPKPTFSAASGADHGAQDSGGSKVVEIGEDPYASPSFTGSFALPVV
jgi:hypothetical protein